MPKLSVAPCSKAISRAIGRPRPLPSPLASRPSTTVRSGSVDLHRRRPCPNGISEPAADLFGPPGLNRLFGRCTASGLAIASAASFLPRLRLTRYGATNFGAISRTLWRAHGQPRPVVRLPSAPPCRWCGSAATRSVRAAWREQRSDGTSAALPRSSTRAPQRRSWRDRSQHREWPRLPLTSELMDFALPTAALTCQSLRG